MLSILIPVYNYNCTKLVQELHRQASLLDQDFEILLADDASSEFKAENKNLSDLSSVEIFFKEENKGRSSTRNLLAEKASFNSLLFLDADVMPVKEDFISNYLEFTQTDKVVFGGILYPEDSDGLYKDSLHYIFGQEREAADGKRGGMSFSSANFMIPKALFQSIQFDESIKGYGYEDVLLHQKIKAHLQVVENPVYHLGIELSNPNYLLKIKEGLRTLAQLYADGKVTEEDVKLIGYYEKMKKYKLRSFYNYSCRLFSKKIEQKITQKDPDIHLFDLYRLNYFTDLMRKSSQDA